jgi:Ca2+-binding EF-hand superfamily protein
MDWFLNSRGIHLSKEIFSELMGLLRLREEKEFCDNIFYMFDEDKDNVIDYKEMVLGLKMSGQDSYNSKVTCKDTD